MSNDARALNARSREGTRPGEELTEHGQPPRAPGRWGRWLAVLVVLAVAATAVVVVEVRRSEDSSTPTASTPTPIGHRKYLVFMIDTVVKNLTFDPGDDFQRVVMGRTPAEIAHNRAAAVEHLKRRFGVDFSTGDNVDGVTFLGWAAPPATNYRAYTISGESVPAEGWQVHDGGWMGIVGPGGATLHGDWGGSEGRWVPEGTYLPFGDYRIDGEVPDGSLRPMFLSYRAVQPVPPPMLGTMPSFSCELTSAEFGAGQALGAYDLRQRPDGQFHVVTRNVLTF